MAYVHPYLSKSVVIMMRESHAPKWSILQFKETVSYFMSNDLNLLFTPALLVFIWGSFILILNHTVHLSHEIVMSFLALFGLITLFNVTYTMMEDAWDGSIDYFITLYGSIYPYLFARMSSLFILLCMPLLCFSGCVMYVLDMPILLFVALSLYSIQMFLSVVTAQLITSHCENRQAPMNTMLLILPSWIPSFLYVVGIVSEPQSWSMLVSFCVMQLGTLLVVSFFVRQWN